MSVSKATLFARPGSPADLATWEHLDQHLNAVGDQCGRFAAAFAAEDWGRLAGHWHDVGKASVEFQDYLAEAARGERPVRGSVDHSTAGAQHAAQFGQPGRLLAYVIAAHHGRLVNASGRPYLDERLTKDIPAWRDRLLGFDPVRLDDGGLAEWTPPITLNIEDKKQLTFQVAFFTRMLFSALVDADTLVSEEFGRPDRTAARASAAPRLEELRSRLDNRLNTFKADSPVNALRADVLTACREAVRGPRGFYSLSVPTGGGKTLSSLAFALGHVAAHSTEDRPLRRVVYAIPFTSIIDQTVAEFERTLGAGGVLAHHGQVVRPRDDETDDPDPLDLVAENFDHPLVVTTNVQLFESLYSARKSACRKLHNLAGSVIILDEAQSLPVRLLEPCLLALKELVANYGCTVVLCTATQPALDRRDHLKFGLEGVREIVPDPTELQRRLSRTRVERLGVLDDEELSGRLAGHRQVLCIVNSRRHAMELFSKLRRSLDEEERDGVFHLSTRMCGAHRVTVLETIRERLKDGKPCRVVSTQLIEAGVDVDFPAVYRDRCGLDSLAQAAGRCNREGRLTDENGHPTKGVVYLFEAADRSLYGDLKQAWQTAEETLPNHKELLSIDAVRSYFQLHLSPTRQSGTNENENPFDTKDVLGAFPAFISEFAIDFATADERFVMIEDDGVPVLVRFGDEGRELVNKLTKLLDDDRRVERPLARRLRSFTVSVPDHEFQSLFETSSIAEHGDGWFVLGDGGYGEDVGLLPTLSDVAEMPTLIS